MIWVALIIILVFFSVLVLALWTSITNPFSCFSIVADPNSGISFDGKTFILPASKNAITVKTGWVFNKLGILKQGWYVLVNKFGIKTIPAQDKDATDIISRIHHERFDPKNIYLISGEHFSVFYPRSLGIFYQSFLDPRTALSNADWYNRQILYLKSAAYALLVFSQSNDLATTIIPIGRNTVTLVNFFAPPSDTLYSIFYALSVLNGSENLTRRYPFNGKAEKLQTIVAAQTLIIRYKESLQKHYKKYIDEVVDRQTGLIKKNILLSSTKDSVMRQSSFYDNAILWKTMQLAQTLGIIKSDQKKLDRLKQKIISTFWLEKIGRFLDDLSEDSVKNNNYSSDWLIAYSTGMISPQNTSEIEYLKKCVAYIKKQKLDAPFPLRYQSDRREYQLYPLLKFFLPQYATTAVWPNLGMEYIKLLAALYQETKAKRYLEDAQKFIKIYEQNIVKFNGYPEVYDESGGLLSYGLYTAVARTGWVVSFEQAREMVKWTAR